jgi:hypothetical protein
MSSNVQCLSTTYRFKYMMAGWHRLIIHFQTFRNIVDGTFLCDREPNIVYCSPLLPASSAVWYQSAIGRLYNALFSLFVGLVHNYYCCVRIHTPPQPYQYLPTDFLIPCAVTYPKCGGCPRNLIYSGSGLSCSHPECLARAMPYPCDW